MDKRRANCSPALLTITPLPAIDVPHPLLQQSPGRSCKQLACLGGLHSATMNQGECQAVRSRACVLWVEGGGISSEVAPYLQRPYLPSEPKVSDEPEDKADAGY